MNSRFDDFYVRFEDHFRGSRADIKERQSVYLSCLALLDRSDASKELLDIGSGRGEWLELLRDHGWRAYGRDLNEVMVQQCRALGLDVEYQDALDHLRSLPDAILTAITGFHIVEHMPFEVLLNLFAETLRVLKPGGMVIFETPNPENFQVGAHTFYLDPTHSRPLAPSLLKFVAEQAGFSFADILRLHPYQELGLAVASDSPIEVHAGWSFFGPQDYSVLAVKGAGEDSTTLYQRMAEMISTLNRQAIKGPISMGQALREAESRAQQAQAQQGEAQAQAQQAEARAQQAEARARQAEAQVQQAEAQVQAAETRTRALLNSLSWRITGPLRAVASLAIKRPTQSSGYSSGTLGNRLVRIVVEIIKIIPGVMRTVNFCERRWPRPWARLLGAVQPIRPKCTMAQGSPPVACDEVAAQRFRRQLELELSRRRNIRS